MNKELKECFKLAKEEEQKGRKHKGLLVTEPSKEKAKEYLDRARDSLRFCDIFKKMGADYKIPEEWYYALYYCALAILCRFGVETRSQRCTALFLKSMKEEGLIDYDDQIIENITVHKEKEKKTAVDEREEARYGSKIKIESIEDRYDETMDMCRKAITQAEQIVFSNKEFKVPKEIL